MRILLFILVGLLLVGCAASPLVVDSDLGTTTLKELDAKSASKGYRRWKSWDYYGYKIVGWNKVMAFPCYAIFDPNEVLVEYIGTMSTKDPDPNDYQVLRKAKFRAAQTMREELANLEPKFIDAGRPLICCGLQMCKKAFTLAQIYISENAGMKIQLATDSIIETYGSTDAVVMKATKIPGEGDTEAITLRVFCPNQDQIGGDETVRLKALIECRKSQINQLNAFSSFLIERVPQLRVQ